MIILDIKRADNYHTFDTGCRFGGNSPDETVTGSRRGNNSRSDRQSWAEPSAGPRGLGGFWFEIGIHRTSMRGLGR